MEHINHFAETNVDDALHAVIERYVEKFSNRTNMEDEIVKMPICARAPLLALYFVKVRDTEKQGNFELLARLFQIAVRVYERHVLYGASNRFIGTDKFDNKNVKTLIGNISKNLQVKSSWECPEVENNFYYKEVVFDLRQRLPNFHVGALLRDYCAMKVMQFVALYAQDVQKFYSPRGITQISDEQHYKQTWKSYKLLTVKNLFLLNDLADEDFAEFFENYSLR